MYKTWIIGLLLMAIIMAIDDETLHSGQCSIAVSFAEADIRKKCVIKRITVENIHPSLPKHILLLVTCNDNPNICNAIFSN